jgi:hypothetical protein
MTKIIDTNNDTTRALPQLKAAGIETIIRYITTSTQSDKCIKPPEARAIADAGLKLGLVFEVWGGSDNFSHHDIHADSGAQHGQFAKAWAANVGAPDGTIIWFAIDNDVSADQFERLVQPYFTSVKAALGGKYRTGIYGCGFACQQSLDSGIADAAWLSNAMGWNGSRNFRATNRWHLLQGLDTHLCGLDIDPNDANESDHGAFVPFVHVAPVTTTKPEPEPTPDRPTPVGPTPGPAQPVPSQSAVDALVAAIQNEFAKMRAMFDTPIAVPPAAVVPQVLPSPQVILPQPPLPPQVVPVPPAATLPQVVPAPQIALPSAGAPGMPAIDFNALTQMLKGLGQLNSTVAGLQPPQATDGTTPTAPPNLSTIDKLLGGQALVGLKTPMAIVAYAVMWIMQSVHAVGPATGPDASTTGQVLTALIAALGGLGLTSKLDRAVQALGTLAGVVQKLQPPPPNPGALT